MKKSQKPKYVEEVKQLVEQSKMVVLAHQKGLTVTETTAIRRQMRAEQGRFKVVKNRLMNFALADEPYNAMLPSFKGPVVMFCTEDPLAAAKISVKAAKDYEGKLTVIAAFTEGKLITVEEVQTLAALPPLDALRGKIVGLLVAAAGNLARLSGETGAMLARLIQAKPAPTGEPAEPAMAEPSGDSASQTVPAGEPSGDTKPANEQVASGDKPAGEASKEVAPAGDKPAGEASKEVAPAGDKPAGEASKEVAPEGDKPAGESSKEVAPAGDKPAGEASKEVAPAGDKPAGEDSKKESPDAEGSAKQT